MGPRETENNAYAKSWGDKKRALWYVMVFSGVVNLEHLLTDKTTTKRSPESLGIIFLRVVDDVVIEF